MIGRDIKTERSLQRRGEGDNTVKAAWPRLARSFWGRYGTGEHSG